MTPSPRPELATLAAAVRQATRQDMRNMAASVCQRVVEAVQQERGTHWTLVVSEGRESPQAASARVLAMAVCCSAGIPMHLVARAFNRTWQTVDSARHRQTSLALSDAAARDEFIRILSRALEASPRA